MTTPVGGRAGRTVYSNVCSVVARRVGVRTSSFARVSPASQSARCCAAGPARQAARASSRCSQAKTAPAALGKIRTGSNYVCRSEQAGRPFVIWRNTALGAHRTMAVRFASVLLFAKHGQEQDAVVHLRALTRCGLPVTSRFDGPLEQADAPTILNKSCHLLSFGAGGLRDAAVLDGACLFSASAVPPASRSGSRKLNAKLSAKISAKLNA